MAFEHLDPDTRCFALVGQFLKAWSSMENALQEAIGAAFGIQSDRLIILAANLGFRDKTNILMTMVDVVPNLSIEEKAIKRNKLRQIAEYSANRNMLAHDMFQPDELGEGVEFLTVKAKGKYALPNVVWKPSQFKEACEEIDQFRDFIFDVASIFDRKPLSDEDFAAVVRARRI